jgi:hypothetical protein
MERTTERGERGSARVVVGLLVALAVVGCTDTAAPRLPTGSPAQAGSSCLAADRDVRAPTPDEVGGDTARATGLRERGLDDDVTVDLRAVAFRADQDADSPGYAPRPVNVGSARSPSGLCLLAPYVRGVQGRELGWEYLKHDPGRGDHPAIRVGGEGWTVVDGARVDNMMNGFRPAGDGLVIRNAYLHYIRDDCVANDDLKALRIEDSLFDGCYTAISARPERNNPLRDGPLEPVDTTMELDHVLVRLAPMPGGHNVFDPEVRTYGHIWKWSDLAGDTVVRDSVFMVEDPGPEPVRELAWPDNVTAEDVTIVWGGEGDYPGEVPDDGVTVVDDRRVWERARDAWLGRHGCRSVDDCDVDRLLDPAPRDDAEPAARASSG